MTAGLGFTAAPASGDGLGFNVPSSTPTPAGGKGGIVSLNPGVDTVADFHTDWQQGKGGVLPAFRQQVNGITGMGYTLGVYDFNKGHHFAPNDPHLAGRAMDVDSVNGAPITGEATPDTIKFVNDVLGRGMRLGLTGKLYEAFKGNARVFHDDGDVGHIHVEMGEGVGDPSNVFTPHAAASGTGLGFSTGKEQATPTGSQLGATAEAGIVPSLSKEQVDHTAHAVAATDNAIRQNWQWASAHPVDEVFSLLGGLQRGVGAYAGMWQQGIPGDPSQRLQNVLGAIARDVFHPGDKINGQDATQRDTESIRALFHAPTHEFWDEYVKGLPKEIQPYMGAILKGGQDMALQTVSDPTTYIDGLGLATKVGGVLKLSMRGQQVASALNALAHSAGVAKYMPWLPKVAALYSSMSTTSSDLLKAAFKPRATLDKVMTDDGRNAALQIENRNRQIARENERADTTAFRSPNQQAAVRTRYLDYLHQNARTAEEQQVLNGLGSTRPVTAPVTQFVSAAEQAKAVAAAQRQMQGKLAKFLAGTPEEMAAELKDMRYATQHYTTAREAHDFLTTHNGWQPGAQTTVGGLQAILGKKTVLEGLNSAEGGGALAKLVSIPRGLMQAALFLNPLPHGLKNVGQLAYLAGGLPAVFRGMKHMIGSTVGKGVPQAMRDRLATIGASANIGEGLRETVWSRIPGWDKTAGGLQNAMSHMEQSWRAGLLETLDKKLGPSRNEADELMKGYMVNDRLGDYHNQAAFVQAFTALGGPWVAFRLGIVPKNVLRAIQENPSRVLAYARGQVDYNRNRPEADQRANSLELGGPITDAAKLVTDPMGYLTSPATTGIVGKMSDAHEAAMAGHATTLDTVGSMLSSMSPFTEPWDIASHFAQGTGMPRPNGPNGKQRFEPESLTDKLVTATMEALAVYYHKAQSEKALQAQKRNDRAIMHKTEKQVRGLLGGGRDESQGFTPEP